MDSHQRAGLGPGTQVATKGAGQEGRMSQDDAAADTTLDLEPCAVSWLLGPQRARLVPRPHGGGDLPTAKIPISYFLNRGRN